ncbi:hypothetical protein [Paenirhodobacter sp. CAU 1674]|uniref:hypothetical protein n=1 Tax=Paenirhodobacter sp. CAU 1674 TaxID=3032596 RepID=UPI0023D9FF9A|nr:hypothetical protein [Paenirhodobacter sp. CAU 1674]MDF2140873.1 hypothetical protein [Paenirhodobacter sp. CAU 1674]
MSWLLTIIPEPIKRALAWSAAAVLALLGAWVAGRKDGRQAAKSEALRKDAEAKQDALEVRNEVDQKSDADVRSALDRWMRD